LANWRYHQDLLVGMQLWMNGKNVWQSDVVTRCDARQHRRHVVEQHLDRPESRTSRIRRTGSGWIVAGSRSVVQSWKRNFAAVHWGWRKVGGKSVFVFWKLFLKKEINWKLFQFPLPFPLHTSYSIEFGPNKSTKVSRA